jgi:hypothetical protein
MTNNFQENQAQNQTNVYEAKTVVNGKVVPVSQAQAAEQQAAQQAQQTGVQAHHSNNSEAVQAGQTAAGATNVNAEQEALRIKQANVQSGQSHMTGQANQTMSHQETLQQTQAKATAKATKKVE